MAPELFDGESRPSKATDIYALGVVISEVCHIAFSGEPVSMDYFHRSSSINDPPAVVSASSYLCWLESVPHDHRAGTSLVSLRMSGC